MTRSVEHAYELLGRATDREQAAAEAAAALEGAARIGETVRQMKTPLDLWRVQNLTFQLGRSAQPHGPLGSISDDVHRALERLAAAVGVMVPAREVKRR